ncbi:ATP-binding domain-containing protein [Methylocystis sp. IM3]|uniref:ATP-binding domain-containing protein n=1 Tax=unclassified Methylocystis TaxID=2625913 RepID=UPI0030FAFD8E
MLRAFSHDNGVRRDEDGDFWYGEVSHDGLDDLIEVMADAKLLRASAAAGGDDRLDPHPPPGCDDLHFGYAITAHTAQGSQWPRVLVKDQSQVFCGDAARWLYTAVTRAARELTLVGGAAPRGFSGWGTRRWKRLVPTSKASMAAPAMAAAIAARRRQRSN